MKKLKCEWSIDTSSIQTTFTIAERIEIIGIYGIKDKKIVDINKSSDDIIIVFLDACISGRGAVYFPKEDKFYEGTTEDDDLVLTKETYTNNEEDKRTDKRRLSALTGIVDAKPLSAIEANCTMEYVMSRQLQEDIDRELLSGLL